MKKNMRARETTRESESKINYFRVKKGLTLKELSLLSAVDPGTISSFNNGMCSPIYVDGRGIKPKALRIAKALGEPVEKVFPRYICAIGAQSLLQYQINMISLSESTMNDPDIDCLIIIKEIQKKILSKIEELTDRERFVIEERFFNDKKLDDVARDLKISRARIRQIETGAIRKLKVKLNDT